MAESYKQTDNDLLRFCLSFYTWDKVEALCLRLQDERGANVNLLLWALWLDSLGSSYEGELWNRAQEIIKQPSKRAKYWRWWRRQCPKWVALKGLRAVIKAKELQAEILVIETLFALGQPSLKGVGGNLKCYLKSLSAVDYDEPLQSSLSAWQLLER